LIPIHIRDYFLLILIGEETYNKSKSYKRKNLTNKIANRNGIFKRSKKIM